MSDFTKTVPRSDVRTDRVGYRRRDSYEAPAYITVTGARVGASVVGSWSNDSATANELTGVASALFGAFGAATGFGDDTGLTGSIGSMHDAGGDNVRPHLPGGGGDPYGGDADDDPDDAGGSEQVTSPSQGSGDDTSSGASASVTVGTIEIVSTDDGTATSQVITIDPIVISDDPLDAGSETSPIGGTEPETDTTSSGGSELGDGAYEAILGGLTIAAGVVAAVDASTAAGVTAGLITAYAGGLMVEHGAGILKDPDPDGDGSGSPREFGENDGGFIPDPDSGGVGTPRSRGGSAFRLVTSTNRDGSAGVFVASPAEID